MTYISEVHQIEVTSRCNLKCVWCPHSTMKRPKIDMDGGTFTKALDLAERLGATQQELWLHGLGESTIHPKFINYCNEARRRLPNCRLRISTNAVQLTREMVKVLERLRIYVHVSVYKPEKIPHQISWLQQAGILEFLGCNPVQSPNNWAGQIEWPLNEVPAKCEWINKGWVYIQADGAILNCCIDVDGNSVIGHVNDENPMEYSTKTFKLCEKCNMRL